MKTWIKYKIAIPALTIMSVLLYACSNNFLNKPPIGSLDQNSLANRAGVEGLLIGAYSMLDGVGGAGEAEGTWVTSADNWVFGDVCSDNAHKGSDPGDQPDIVGLMTWDENASNGYIEGKWQSLYDAIQRCNDVIRIMRLATDIEPADTVEITAEARFLRGLYEFEAYKLWGNYAVYVDEGVTYQAGNWRVPNGTSILPNVQADFQYAQANLPATQPEAGRANKYAAEAFLADTYLYQQDYNSALPLLQDLINNGETANGQKYTLLPNFADNFNPATNHADAEAVFQAQMSVNDGAGANNANAGDVLNFPYSPSSPGTCCGFDQPSYSLVNSYKTDPVTGLPDPDHFNDSDIKNDEGLASTDPFTPYTGTIDPRLDFTVGRRGIPFYDWGIMPGYDWIRNQASAGPYINKKDTYYKSQQGTYTDNSSWTPGYTANNYNYIRFAQVLLWAAEAEVQAGSLDQAEAYVNMVRNRAANPTYWVKMSDGSNAANYYIKPYPAGYFTLVGKDRAMTLVEFEEKLELAMEGHRFFDLVRWGTAASVLNAYAAHEVASGYTLLKGATFTAGKNEYLPVPQQEIDRSTQNGKDVLVQNPAW